MRPANPVAVRLRMIRNFVILVLGVALLGIGFWALAFTSQGVWYVGTDIAGGLIMVLVSILWLTRYK